MGYPSQISGVARAVTDSIFTFSSPMSMVGMNLGARMMLIKTTDSTFSIYSTMPHTPAVIDAFNKVLLEKGHLKQGESFEDKVTSIVIPNKEHTMALPGWENALKGKNISIIGPHKCNDKVNHLLSCHIPESEGHKSLTGTDLVKFGLNPNDPLATTGNFKFMYFPSNVSLELIMLDEKEKTLLEGDLMFNLQHDHKKNPDSDLFNEQFGNEDPQKGLGGWLTKKLLIDQSWLNSKVFNMLFKDKIGSKQGVDTVSNEWKFDKIIPIHGDTIDRNGVEVWKNNFGFL